MALNWEEAAPSQHFMKGFRLLMKPRYVNDIKGTLNEKIFSDLSSQVCSEFRAEQVCRRKQNSKKEAKRVNRRKKIGAKCFKRDLGPTTIRLGLS